MIDTRFTSTDPPWRPRTRLFATRGWRRLRGGALTPLRGGLSVALGLFVGCLPVFGLHLPLCVGLCLPFRLDAPVAYLAANISNPFVAPWLIVAEIQVGALFLTGQFAPFDVAAARAVGVGPFVLFATVGAVAVGSCLAAAGGFATWASLAFLSRRRLTRKQPIRGR